MRATRNYRNVVLGLEVLVKFLKCEWFYWILRILAETVTKISPKRRASPKMWKPRAVVAIIQTMLNNLAV